MALQIKALYDEVTCTLTYVVYDPKTKDTVVLDPVLDYEPQGAVISKESLQKLLEFVRSEKLNVRLILETHVHADHLTGAQELKFLWPEARLGIGKHITQVQELFKKIFNLPDAFATNGRQFDILLSEGEKFEAGSLSFDVLHTPGHTPACSSYRFGDAVFVGDAIFMPDYGTGRCDFPGGSAGDLFDSITRKLYTLHGETRLYTAHDYKPGGRDLQYVATVAEQKRNNVQLSEGRSRDQFIKFRSERDKTLKPPRLLFPSIQINVTGGHLPTPEDNGTRYLKIPLRYAE